jgi:CRISPR/Cas system CSM-associated protein Csm3 (group 7 of RAMP superfamily)
MKTAVEKFRESFYDYAEPYNGFSEEPKWTISEEDFEKLIQQAKEMEKEQMGDAYERGYNAVYYGSNCENDN